MSSGLESRTKKSLVHPNRTQVWYCLKITVVTSLELFSKWSRTFIEFNEFRESDKSLMHELGEGWISATFVLLALWKHPGLLRKRWLVGRFEPFYCNDRCFCLRNKHCVWGLDHRLVRDVNIARGHARGLCHPWPRSGVTLPDLQGDCSYSNTTISIFCK